jgi:lysophospholipase L1-like esterase
MQRWKKAAILILFGLIGVAVFLEVGLRILGAHNPVLYQTAPVLGYRLKPNQHVSFFGNEISTNRFGVRDDRSFDTKEPNVTRILVLGDSVTWGGVRMPQDELFTSILEQELGDAEVINAGINGYSVWRMASFYRRHLNKLKPDVVVMYVIPADFHRPAVVDLVGTSPAFPLKRPAFALSSALVSAQIVLAAKLDWDWIRPQRPDMPRDNRSDDDRILQNLEAIVDLNDTLSPNQRLIVVVSPFPDHANNPPLPDAVANALVEAKIETLVLEREALRADDNFVDHIHFNARGHAMIGQTLAEYLRESVEE